MLALVIGTLSLPAQAQTGFTYSSAQSKTIIETKARGVVNALRDRHMNRLAGFVHPTKGLQFSPYVHAGSTDRRFAVSRVRHLGKNQKLYYWGEYDGSGAPIRLTWRNYFFKFVYSRDFASTPNVSYNIIKSRGNTPNNLHSFYPGSIVVEYHSPDPAGPGGLNWQSLWLVFQPRVTTWYLVGIAHDQWTI
jgi:hypothetical protein